MRRHDRRPELRGVIEKEIFLKELPVQQGEGLIIFGKRRKRFESVRGRRKNGQSMR